MSSVWFGISISVLRKGYFTALLHAVIAWFLRGTVEAAILEFCDIIHDAQGADVFPPEEPESDTHEGGNKRNTQ